MKVIAWLFIIFSILLFVSGIIAAVFFTNKINASIALINILASYATILSLTIAISFYAFDKSRESIEKDKQIKSIIDTLKKEIITIKKIANEKYIFT